ncbi:formaldehyde dehydrogenase, glutathione-independent [Pseudomonas citronellolis]|uniref:formaldehyde dehydrogenase, glutathione-independent n=1 Tax=Pseudomonas citronellolis TaxID=53408 RepID=UPI000778D421|nr:formaldehyde dehydrogenase, glutathione-independent [Pseudomonas citronellolis]AMO76107.1 Glutathione-independent formaldehyde dehydrogenase [Pseudomonas citronellolis]
MSGNRGVVYLGPGKVEVQNIPYPKMQDPQGKQIDHGVILRVVSTNICGSDLHMVRSRTTAPTGLVLGHEITGEVVEIGRGVETMKIGDLVSVPFNVACGHCRTCKEQHTGVCLTVNPARAGGAYGYVDMGGWVGGQAEYVLVPYADFNLLKLPDREKAMEKIRDLTCLSDILPTGYHGAVTAGVGPGSSVYIAGAGPVGLAAAASARLLGAAVVIIGDVNPTRLAHAKAQGFEIADLSKDTPLHEQIADLLGEPEVDCAVDAVGFEARGHGHSGSQHEAPATVLNSLMGITRVAGQIGIPGLYVTEDPGAVDDAAKHGALSIRFGLGWAKSHSFHTGQTPVMKYNRQLMQAIMWDRIKIADIVGVEVITLDEAPKGYGEFDAGVPKKFVIDPHNLFRAA